MEVAVAPKPWRVTPRRPGRRRDRFSGRASGLKDYIQGRDVLLGCCSTVWRTSTISEVRGLPSGRSLATLTARCSRRAASVGFLLHDPQSLIERVPGEAEQDDGTSVVEASCPRGRGVIDCIEGDRRGVRGRLARLAAMSSSSAYRRIGIAMRWTPFAIARTSRRCGRAASAPWKVWGTSSSRGPCRHRRRPRSNRRHSEARHGE